MVVYRFAFRIDFLGSYVTQWSATRFIVACASLVCYTGVFSVVTQCSFWGGALRDDTKNGCVADKCLPKEKKSLRQPIVPILKTVHLQQLKVMLSSKLGM